MLHASVRSMLLSPKHLPRLAAIIGLCLWVGSAAGLLLRGIDEKDRLRGRVALTWAAGIVAGFALFLAGLALA